MMSRCLWILTLALAASGARAQAETTDAGNEREMPSREPAAAKQKAKAPARSSRSKPKAPPRQSHSSSADSTEYTIKRTEKGLVKIPSKQTFKFRGTEVEGQAQNPSQSVFGKRPEARSGSLIPERTSFKREFLESMSYPGR